MTYWGISENVILMLIIGIGRNSQTTRSMKIKSTKLFDLKYQTTQ